MHAAAAHARRLLSLASLALAASGACGCGGEACEAYCDAVVDCDSAEFTRGDGCADECHAAVDDVEERAGCGGELEAVLDCSASAEDACNARECTDEAASYLGCAGLGG